MQRSATREAISVVQYLAIDTSTMISLPSMWSAISLSMKVRPSLISVAISTISNWVFWNLASGRPKAVRSLQYWIVISSMYSAAATAPIAQTSRSGWSCCISLRKPDPFWPMRFALGIRQSLK